MASPDSKSVITVLREAADFAEQVGLKKEAAAFEEFHQRFLTEKPTFKALRSGVEPVRNELATKVRSTIYDYRREPLPGKEAMVERYERLSLAFLHMLYPPEPKPLELDLSGFAGSKQVKEKRVTYAGDEGGVRKIVESSIVLIERYARVLGAGDFEGAYALTDSGLREWMSLKRFISDHERAAEEYHGPALEFHIDRFNFVYADDAARKKSTADEGWPKGTPKENRRAGVGGFWIRDRSDQTGCGGTLWIAEEQGLYRIAKFNFWRP
jgi:hypothetical protein